MKRFMGNAFNRKYFIAAGDQTHFSAAGAMTNTDDERLLMSKDISSFVMCAGHGTNSVGDRPTTGSYRQE